MLGAGDGDRLTELVEALTGQLDGAQSLLRELADEVGRVHAAGGSVEEIAEAAELPQRFVVGVLEGKVRVDLLNDVPEEPEPSSSWVMTWTDPPQG